MWSAGIRERHQRRQAHALSRAIRGLSSDTRRAMLVAIEADDVIVGAYTDRSGRVCPMLAAYRRGARTDAVGAFPRAWDAFGQARRPRLATTRELDILRALLEESLAGGAPPPGPPQRSTTPDESWVDAAARSASSAAR